MITWLSNDSELKKLIKGTMHRYLVPIQIDRNKGTLERLTLFSNGKRGTILRYLVGKLLWDELSLVERDLLYLFPESTKFPIYQILQSIKTVGKKLTRNNYNSISHFFRLNTLTREQYLSMKSQIVVLIRKDQRNLPKGPKYSGYCKGYKDHGSLGTEREYYSQEWSDTVVNREEMFLSFLTVKEYRQGYLLLTMAKIEGRNSL